MNTIPRLLVAALLVMGSLTVRAEPSPTPDEVQMGPVDVPQNLQGVPVNIRVTSLISVKTSPTGISVRTRTFGDLRDLQAKIGSVVDTFPVPRDNCRSFSGNNPVVKIHTKRLDLAGAAVVFTLAGDVEGWDCRENPIPNSKVEWVEEKWLGVPVRRPKIVTWPGSPIKNLLITQPITAKLTARLQLASDSTVQLVMDPPQVELGGHHVLAAVRDALLNLFKVDINKLAEQQLRQAIDPAALQVALPDDVKRLGAKLQKASFVDVGALGVEIQAQAQLSSANITELLKALADHKKP